MNGFRRPPPAPANPFDRKWSKWEKRMNDRESILALAVEREEEAARVYGLMKDQAASPTLKSLLEELVKQEIHHKEKLLSLSAEDVFASAENVPAAAGMTDALDEEPFRPGMTLQELMIFAARKERQAADFYEAMAAGARNPEIRGIFTFLRDQELQHKKILEDEYDKHFLAEN